MEPRAKYAIAIGALFVLVFALRLAVAFQVENPSYESYFTLIQSDSITSSGLPRTADPFSYEGRHMIVTPLFYYVVSLFSFAVPELLLMKVLPNLLMALLVPLVYLIAYQLTRNRLASLAAAFFGGFSPLIFTSYINSAQPLCLGLPIAVALLYTLLDLEAHPGRALLLTALLILISPISWLFVGVYLVYLLILAGERQRIAPAYLEAALFTFLLTVWFTLIAYKTAIYRYGLYTVALSLPQSVRVVTFSDLSLLATVYAVGVVPLLLGSLAAYHAIFEQRNRRVYLVAALSVSTIGAALFQLMPLRVALLLLSITFVILSAPGLALIISYMKKTRLVLAHIWLSAAILAFFIVSSLIPSLALGIFPQSSPTPSEVEALSWLRASSPNSSVVLAAPKEGFFINYEAQRPYVADEEYILIANPNRIVGDIDAAYTTPSTVAAIEFMEKYKVSYVLLGPSENARYPELGAISTDRICFPIAHQNAQVSIYSVKCASRSTEAPR